MENKNKRAKKLVSRKSAFLAIEMKTYNVDEAFEILKENKTTTHKESIRRWLRTGVMKGVAYFP